jgi:type III secretion protein R
MNTDSIDPFALLLPLLLLGLAPFAAIMVTCYAKLVVVFALVRNGLGVQQVPPNIVLNSLALILSAYIMAPIGQAVADQLERHGVSSSGKMKTVELMNAIGDAREPLREFLIKHGKERERKFFVKSAGKLWPSKTAERIDERDFLIAIPAFTLSQLTSAFEVGFVIYLCFVGIDLIIANVLLALGMSMVSPTVVAVPFKLLLFIALDGWSALIHALILSYQ